MSDGKVKVMVIREIQSSNSIISHLIPSSEHPKPKEFLDSFYSSFFEICQIYIHDSKCIFISSSSLFLLFINSP